jgi:DNA-binding response OmpR family regulator
MPGISGIELLHEIRSKWPHIAVIMLTGHGTLDSAMKAIKEDAFDYLLKPAQTGDIISAVDRALLAARRQRDQDQLVAVLKDGLERLGELPPSPAPKAKIEAKEIFIGQLKIDPQSHQVWRDKNVIPLTPSEYKLLLVLAERSGQVIDYITLVQLALEYDAEPWEAKELIKRHIFSLRQKIEPEPAEPIYILNVRGVGYRMAADHEFN